MTTGRKRKDVLFQAHRKLAKKSRRSLTLLLQKLRRCIQAGQPQLNKNSRRRITCILCYALVLLGVLLFRFQNTAPSASLIDVVVVTHDALTYTRQGLVSIKQHTLWNESSLILVDSGSTQETLQWLTAFCSPTFCALHKLGNIGYTKAVNFGILAGKSTYVIVMNPDVIVYEEWTARLLRGLLSCPTHGIVGPLSNAASFQSIPHVYDASGSHAVNNMSVEQRLEVVNLLRVHTAVEYPRMTFVNGFLFMMKRSIYEMLDGFDEDAFPIGYGEENDFAIRAQRLGFTIALADDVFAYHFKTTAFTSEERKNLAKLGSIFNRKKHEDVFNTYLQYMKSRVPFTITQNRIRDILLPQKVPEIDTNYDRKVVYVLPVQGAGGGVISVVQEVHQMRLMNLDAYVAIRESSLQFYEMHFPDMIDVFMAFSTIDELATKFVSGDTIVATHFTSVKLLLHILDKVSDLQIAYYVQDYEPNFHKEGSSLREEAVVSYNLFPDAILFSKTKWIADQILTKHGVPVSLVTPSIDHQLFRPASCKMTGSGLFSIVAMVRPATPRRGASATVQVLRALKLKFGSRIQVHTFGCSYGELHHLCVECSRNDTFFEHHGILNRKEVADLISQTDFFLDMSTYQAFGRSLAECMASGCIPIGPLQGGSAEFINEDNGLLIDTSQVETCIQHVIALLSREQSALRLMSLRATIDVSHMTLKAAARSQMNVFGLLDKAGVEIDQYH